MQRKPYISDLTKVEWQIIRRYLPNDKSGEYHLPRIATHVQQQQAIRDAWRPALGLEDIERQHILDVLEATGGVVKGPQGAAAILKIPASTLYDRMQRLNIRRGGRNTR